MTEPHPSGGYVLDELAVGMTAGDINRSVITMFSQRFTAATENEAIEPLKGESSLVSEQAVGRGLSAAKLVSRQSFVRRIRNR